MFLGFRGVGLLTRSLLFVSGLVSWSRSFGVEGLGVLGGLRLRDFAFRCITYSFTGIVSRICRGCRFVSGVRCSFTGNPETSSALVEWYTTLRGLMSFLSEYEAEGLRRFLICPIQLGGSWVVISTFISRVTILITHIRGHVTTLITTHEPPSRDIRC